MKRGWLLSTIVLSACSPTVSGEVRDATSDQPIAHAMVEVTTSGWGVRGGGLVWDKDFSYRAQSGPDGHFRIAGADGGHRLSVSAPGYPPVQTSLCSRSPMTIWVGGRFDGADFGKTLSLGDGGNRIRMGWRFSGAGRKAPESGSDLVALGLPSADKSVTSFRAPLGVAFRSGTGNPPQAPQSGYAVEQTLDLLDCGWLFVRTGDSGTVPVKIGSFGLDEPPGEGRYLMLSYATARPH
ncbi:carboxypeptidase-like regulatory domain-containing protein [Sphingomonas sp.]|uniref:carboxypeptidase-like regulatory domain-containing protein n=1 Tax=Sphingomonas sp. TaxID=28214 RepID=UPI00286D1351|nr:carboxypeptidase-like regulatory domain-containing protein [Sphingomonas sp.]